MTINRRHWLRDVKEVVRSRHYTWMPRGLGGHSVEEAMTYLATDIMHICKLSGIPVDRVMENARQKYEEEETTAFPAEAPTREIAHLLPKLDGDEVVMAYKTNDIYDAEIIRGTLQSDGIACRLDSQAQGGVTDHVETKILVRATDADRAHAAIHRKPSSVEPHND